MRTYRANWHKYMVADVVMVVPTLCFYVAVSNILCVSQMSKHKNQMFDAMEQACAHSFAYITPSRHKCFQPGRAVCMLLTCNLATSVVYTPNQMKDMAVPTQP